MPKRSDLLLRGALCRTRSFAAFTDAQREASRQQDDNNTPESPKTVGAEGADFPELQGSKALADPETLRTDRASLTEATIATLGRGSGGAMSQTYGEYINTWLNGIERQTDSPGSQLEISRIEILDQLAVRPGQL